MLSRDNDWGNGRHAGQPAWQTITSEVPRLVRAPEVGIGAAAAAAADQGRQMGQPREAGLG